MVHFTCTIQPIFQNKVLTVQCLSKCFFFYSPELKAQVSFSDRLSSICPSVRKLFTFNLLFQNHWANFSHIRHNFCSNEGPHPSPWGDNGEIVKLYWKYLKIFFSRFTGPISTKLGTKHSKFLLLSSVVCLSVRLSVCKLFTSSSSPEPLGQFQPNLAQSIPWWREFKFSKDNYHTVKNALTNFKIFFSWTSGQYTQTWHKAYWGDGDLFS